MQWSISSVTVVKMPNSLYHELSFSLIHCQDTDWVTGSPSPNCVEQTCVYSSVSGLRFGCMVTAFQMFAAAKWIGVESLTARARRRHIVWASEFTHFTNDTNGSHMIARDTACSENANTGTLVQDTAQDHLTWWSWWWFYRHCLTTCNIVFFTGP